MPRPLTRAQALENAAFLRALRRTGNAREAARTLGAHRAKFTRRRAAHPAFAAEWDAALALADAALRTQAPAIPRTPTTDPRVIRTKSGRHQLRRPIAGQLTPDHRQRFLAALSATANVRLSAAAAGLTHAAFYQLRTRDPGFAREWRLALQEGYERIEMALHEGFLPSSYKDDAWRHNEPPPIPPMTVNQALQLLHLHQKEARLLAEPPHVRRRRGESREAQSFRLAELYKEGQRRAREAFDIAEAGRRERGEPCLEDSLTHNLPDLAQVTGWSRARSVEEGEGAGCTIPTWRCSGGGGLRLCGSGANFGFLSPIKSNGAW